MSDDQRENIQVEPLDSGTDPVQGVGPLNDSTSIVKAKARGPLEGHALPEALSSLGPAFRSHPAWVLVCQWTNQVFQDHENVKRELLDTKRKLESTSSDYVELRIRNIELTEKLRGAKRISSYTTRWQVAGTLLLGLSPAAYLNTRPIYGILLAGVGLLFLYFAWSEDRES
jgi:hypothetical protein